MNRLIEALDWTIFDYKVAEFLDGFGVVTVYATMLGRHNGVGCLLKKFFNVKI